MVLTNYWKINLDTLRAFDAHPDPLVQLDTFTNLVQEHGQVTSWQVRRAFQNRWVRVGDAVGAFVREAYIAAGGEVLADLIEEDSILADGPLVTKLLAEQLQARPEQMPDRNTGAEPRSESSAAGSIASPSYGSSSYGSSSAPVGPKLSAKLAGDMAHIRTRAVGLALAQSPDVARDYADYTLIRQVLGDWCYSNATSLRAEVASRGPDEVAGSLAQIEDVFGALRGGLKLDWIEIDGADGFADFRALPETARADLLAYAVAQTLEAKLVLELRDPVREVVEIEVLPNLRDVWTPDEVFLKRLTKSDLLEILRDMDMRGEAQAYQKAKKSGLVAYMVKLFAEPFATLTDRQRTAVTNWCPAVMTRTVMTHEVMAHDGMIEDAMTDDAMTRDVIAEEALPDSPADALADEAEALAA